MSNVLDVGRYFRDVYFSISLVREFVICFILSSVSWWLYCIFFPLFLLCACVPWLVYVLQVVMDDQDEESSSKQLKVNDHQLCSFIWFVGHTRLRVLMVKLSFLHARFQ